MSSASVSPASKSDHQHPPVSPLSEAIIKRRKLAPLTPPQKTNVHTPTRKLNVPAFPMFDDDDEEYQVQSDKSARVVKFKIDSPEDLRMDVDNDFVGEDCPQVTQKAQSIDVLPDSLMVYLFSMLPHEELAQMSFLSKRFLKLSSSEVLWKRLLESYLDSSYYQIKEDVVVQEGLDLSESLTAKAIFAKIFKPNSFFSNMVWDPVKVKIDSGIRPELLPTQFHTANLVDNERIVLFGGYRSVLLMNDHGNAEGTATTFQSANVNYRFNYLSNDVFQLDMRTNPWTLSLITCNGTPPTNRAGHCSVMIDREIYILGGGRSDNTIFTLNVDTFEWRTLNCVGNPPGLSISRYLHGVHVLNDNKSIGVVGAWNGTFEHNEWLDIRVLDTETGVWTKCDASGQRGYCDGHDSSVYYEGKMHFLDSVNQNVCVLDIPTCKGEDSSQCALWTRKSITVSDAEAAANRMVFPRRSILSNARIGNKLLCWHGSLHTVNPRVFDLDTQVWIPNLEVAQNPFPVVRNGYSAIPFGVSVIIIGSAPPLPPASRPGEPDPLWGNVHPHNFLHEQTRASFKVWKLRPKLT
jgi:hypothetical protein